MYSDAEKRLIAYFNMTGIAELIEPPAIYPIMMEKAFCRNMQGEAVESLRRCCIALQQCFPYRLTPEWDKLIILDRGNDGLMSFNTYQQAIREMEMYPHIAIDPYYVTLGLCGETGEVADKMKKVHRDNDGKFTPDIVEEIGKELGDVLWNLAALASVLGLQFDDVARRNIEKLRSRVRRNTINGNGDNR
jgi:NTP pyrophosphatase (non-canonical NTP hydrolase)